MSYAPDNYARRRWCAALAKLCSPSFPDQAAEALTDMLPALSHLPEHMFTEATLIEVAGSKRRQAVPAFDEIVAALNHYRRTYLPDPTLRLAAPAQEPDERRPPSPEEVAVVAELLTSWKREMAERRAELEEAEREQRRESKREIRDVCASGESLAVIRRERFARLMADPSVKLKLDEVPEPYRPVSNVVQFGERR